MILIFSFIIGLFFYQLNIFKNQKLNYLILFLIFLLSIFYISIDVITGEGFNRSFWLHLQSDLKGATYVPYLLIFFFRVFVFFIFFLIGYFLQKKIFQFFQIKNYYLRMIIFLSIIFLNPASISLVKSFKMTYNNSIIKNNLDFKDYFKSIDNLSENFENRDLIIITAESLERTFYTNAEIKKNINLSLLERNDIIDFTNINQAKGYTDWTIAGIVASNCGLPLVHYSFYSNFNCLTDLLSKRKYNLTTIQGTSPVFAGNGNFYKIHNVRKIIGKNEISSFFSEKKIESSYWGIHDHVVLDYATDQIKNLENQNNPYAVWINTVDTHPPNGLLSNKCKKITKHVKSNFLKVVKCTDAYLNNFINQINEYDINQNNLIVIHSDHLLMNSPITKKYFKDENKRKNLFLIIDPYKNSKKIIDTRGNTLDIPATILDYLKGGKELGLGASLLSNNKKKIESLSSNNQDLSYIIKAFENDLKNINEKITFLNGKILTDENLINLVEFETGFRVKLPLLSVNNEITEIKTDAKGLPSEKIETMIFREIVKKNRKVKFQAIGNCDEINFALFSKKIECKFMYVDVDEIDNKINFKIYPYDEYFDKNIYLTDNINKKDFISKINNLNGNPYSLSILFENFRKDIRTNLNEFAPEIYPAINKFYLYSKYNYKKFYFNLTKDKKALEKKFLLKDDTLIAHAGGIINKILYTNSLEALDYNYNLGAKYFELDLNLTSDNQIVAVQDWKSWKKRTKYTGEIPPTLKNFLEHRIDGKFSPLNDLKILDWFLRHPDASLVTHRLNDALLLKKVFKDIENNLIIRLGTEDSINKALSSDFSKILISQKIIWKNNYSESFLNYLLYRKNVPYGFSVSKDIIYEKPNFFKLAKSLGFKIYVYDMNEELKNNISNISIVEGKALCNLHNYIDGIFANVILQDKLRILDLCG